MVRIAEAERTAIPTRDEVAELPYPSTSLWRDAWRRLIRNKAAVLGMIIILLFIFVATFASFLAPHNPLKINDGLGFLPPARQVYPEIPGLSSVLTLSAEMYLAV